ncbi:unnamed protein product [Orchesella dallaii]|uniref:Uncharacterized protein n=1 Tax=Orchesella dallaii TaxID=48710 RepID=A0ABP1QCP9_9HEXA
MLLNETKLVGRNIPMPFGTLDSDKNIESLMENPPLPTFIFTPFKTTENNLPNEIAAAVKIVTNVCFVFFHYESNTQFITRFTGGKIQKVSRKSSDIKTAISHENSAELFETNGENEPNTIFHNWRKLNVKWNLDISKGQTRISRIAEWKKLCENMRKLYSLVAKKSMGCHNCVKGIIFHRHNCSEMQCELFFGFLLLFAENMIHEGSQPQYVHKYGYDSTGYRFAYFLKFEGKNEMNMLFVFKPVPHIGWLILLSVAVSLAMLMRYLKVCKNSLLAIYQILLEQDVNLKSKSAIGCALAGLWLFACILTRNVYTSTIFSFLTVKPRPHLPNSLEDALENYTHLEILYNPRSDMEIIVERGPIIGSIYVKDDFTILWRRRRPLYSCSLTNDSSFTIFLNEFATSSEISCVAHGSKSGVYFNNWYKPEKRWGDVVLIYNTRKKFDALISIFGNRRRFEEVKNEFNVTTKVYFSPFQSIFSRIVDNDLAALEQSGILQRLRFEYDGFEALWLLKSEMKRASYRRIKGWINPYAAVHQSKSLMSEVARQSIDDLTAATLESVVVAWVLYGAMLVVCFSALVIEFIFV